MPEHEARFGAFYDHESDEQPRTGGRRRRPAADWGVGEDIFDRMPSRRFTRAEQRAEHGPVAVQEPRRRERSVETSDADAWSPPVVVAREPEPDWAGELAPEYGEAPRIAGNGRRTVLISGHPDRLPIPRPERAPRTAVERIGARPDRIVGYAVALGLLLIAIAILTT